MTVQSRQLIRLTAIMRGVVVVGILGPVLWGRDTTALLVVAALAAVWLFGQVGIGRRGIGTPTVVVAEAFSTGVVAALGLHTEPAVLAALVVPPFIAGLYLGVRGIGVAMAAQLVGLVVITFAFFGPPGSEQSLAALSWAVGGLGLGLVATFVRSTVLDISDDLAPYLHAQELIRELIDLTQGLRSGLDADELGTTILSTVRDRLPTAVVGLYVPHGDRLSPLVIASTEARADLDTTERVAVDAWARADMMISDRTFAWPVGETAVVAGLLSDRVDANQIRLESEIEKLERDLSVDAVHLDTALLFAAFKHDATADERQRLAREMQDGVAQDIASLGYLVDALAADPSADTRDEQIAILRERITAVVGEVRTAVLSLRSGVGESPTLGTAISVLARQVSETAQIPIEVTVDEHAARLRPDVEAELFRIAQEAMNNAVKHEGASTVDILCQVHAPDARIVVADDGRDVSASHPDPPATRMMRERAALVDGELTVENHAEGGVTVAVLVGRSVGQWSASGAAEEVADPPDTTDTGDYEDGDETDTVDAETSDAGASEAHPEQGDADPADDDDITDDDPTQTGDSSPSQAGRVEA